MKRGDDKFVGVGDGAVINVAVDTCENSMSFVTTTCVPGRIIDHGGYVGFRA
jgi:hypothetical protein